MCGRYANFLAEQDLIDHFAVAVLADDARLAPSWNIAPTQLVQVVRRGNEGEGRAVEVARWGLVPSWAKDPSAGARMFNARIESAADKPAFRQSVRTRRAIVGVDEVGRLHAIRRLPLVVPICRNNAPAFGKGGAKGRLFSHGFRTRIEHF